LTRRTDLSLEKGENVLNKLNGIGSLEERGINVGGSLLLHAVEISLILSISLELLADFRKFVVGDKEVLAIV